MISALSHRPLITEIHTEYQADLCGICGGHNGTEADFSPNNSVFPVSVITRMLHTDSLICCRRYVVLASDTV
jgi:hypothetical protein